MILEKNVEKYWQCVQTVMQALQDEKRDRMSMTELLLPRDCFIGDASYRRYLQEVDQRQDKRRQYARDRVAQLEDERYGSVVHEDREVIVRRTPEGYTSYRYKWDLSYGVLRDWTPCQPSLEEMLEESTSRVLRDL